MTDTRRVTWRTVWTIALGILAGSVATIGTVAVAVAGFALSYDAIRAVGIGAHIRESWAWLLPVSVDGAMAVATVAAVVLRHATGRTPRYPWFVVIAGAGISIACNGLHATGTLLDNAAVRFAVSAIPPVMLALSIHLLVVLVEVSYRAATSRDTDTDPTEGATRDVAATPGASQVAADVAPPSGRLSHDTGAANVAVPVSLVRPFVVSHVASPNGTRHVADAVAEDVAVDVAEVSGDTDSRLSQPESRPATRRATPPVARHTKSVSRPSDTDKTKIARRRVAKGESCASVARSLDVSAKTVERWTKDIRDSREGATPSSPDDDQERLPVNGREPEFAGVA